MADDLIIDLTNYKDRVGATVDPGRYRVQVEDIEVGNSNAGNKMITLWLRILGGPFDGYKIIDRLTQTEGALWRTVSFMQAIGLPTPNKRLGVKTASWVGRVLEVDVEDGDPYQGKVKSEVRGHIRVERPVTTDVDEVDELGGGGGLDEFAGTDTAEARKPVMAPQGGDDDVVDLDDLSEL